MHSRLRLLARTSAILLAAALAATAPLPAHADRAPVPSEKPTTGEPTDVAKPTSGRPIPNAPKIDLREGDNRPRAGEVSVQSALAGYLPFNFSYSFSNSLLSRTFWPSSWGSACISLRVTGSTDPYYFVKEIKVEMWDAYGVDTRIGLPVRYPANGYYYGYCWYGLNAYHEHYFRLSKDWGPASVWGDGWASVS